MQAQTVSPHAAAPDVDTAPVSASLAAIIDDKRDAILEHEHRFARHLAFRVVDQPEVHVWMILIPFIFVIHIFRAKRAKEARASFASGYMLSRKKIVTALWERLRTAETPAACRTMARDEGLAEVVDDVCSTSGVAPQAMQAYRAYMELLTQHYARLFCAEPEKQTADATELYDELVRASYPSRKAYARFFSELNRAERIMNHAIQQNLDDEDVVEDEASQVVETMEKYATSIRRDEAKDIFS